MPALALSCVGARVVESGPGGRIWPRAWQRLEDKKAHYIAVVKRNQPLLHARIKALPGRQVPAGITVREIG